MGMPDTEAKRFRDAVEWGARDVHKKWGNVFDMSELASEAWAVASERWQAWETTGHARTDTKLRVFEYVASQLPSKGFVRKTVDGKRKWVREAREIPASHYLGMFVPGLRQDTYADHGGPLVLLPRTKALNASGRQRYADILFDHFPDVVAEFERNETAKRPKGMRTRDHLTERERSRKDLYWTYNMELRLAMQEMEMARGASCRLQV
jgi:hypothetical protein